MYGIGKESGFGIGNENIEVRIENMISVIKKLKEIED